MECVKRQTYFPLHILFMSFRCFTTYVHYFSMQSEEVPGTAHSGDFRNRGTTSLTKEIHEPGVTSM